MLSPNGRWTAILDREVGSLELEDGQGVEQSMFPAGSAVAEAKWSPDNRMLAVVLDKQPENGQSGVGSSPPEIRLVEFADGEFHKLGSAYKPEEPLAAPSQIILGAWSPDGKRLLFWTGLLSASIRADGLPLWVLDVEEMQATRLAETALLNPDYQSWSPEGSALVITDGGYRSAQVGKRLSLYEVASGQVTTLVHEDKLVPGQVAWSPAGTTIAFAAVEASQTGQDLADWMSWDNTAIRARHIYLLDPQTGGYRRLNAAEAYQDAPRWSGDGEMLYYVEIDGDQARVMATNPASGEAQPVPGCQAPLPETAGYYGQVDWTELFENCPQAEESGVEAIDPIRTLFGLPDLPLEFIETTTMINSPHGDLLVARYQDTEGRNYFVEPQSNQIVEIDAREALSAIPPEAPAYPKEALSAKAEELIRGAIPNFDSLQAELSYEEDVKGDQYFFDWRAAITPGSFNPPLAQIGLHKSGELFAYFNTLNLSGQTGATISEQATEHAT